MTRCLRTLVPVIFVCGSVGAAGAADPVRAMPTISLDGARQVLQAAVDEAHRRGVGGAFAVVDVGGSLVAMERLDGTFAAAAHVAIDKARTSAQFQKPTRVFEDLIRGGRTPMLALTDFTPLQGGVPIVLDGRVIGAIGVSGASSASEDDQLAEIGAAAITRTGMTMRSAEPGRSEVVSLESANVRSAFARGMPLLENSRFKIHASRRTEAGEAEIHEHETDIFYLLDGTATFVTGGTLVDARLTTTGELRGSGIAGGQEHTLAAGDVIVIPAGMPHWFKDVDGPVLYYVVKVIEP